jgi:allophanate hydrolase subunit 2
MYQMRVLELQGPAWVQGLAVRGASAWGLPGGGALVPEALIAANLRVGNRPDALGVEFFGRLRVEGEGASPDRRIEKGELLFPVGRVGYLALRGGIEVPPVLGSAGWRCGRGVQLKPGLCLPLGRGDARAPPPPPPDPFWSPDRPLRVVPGPAPWLPLFSQRWRAGEGDRTGLRLQGEPLPAGEGRGASTPMVPGAIQLPPDGIPIVLGPDHPLTGGYPVVGVVIQADLGALFGRTRGAGLQLLPVDPAQGRHLDREHPLLRLHRRAEGY